MTIKSTVYPRRDCEAGKRAVSYSIEFQQENGLWKGIFSVDNIVEAKTMGMPNKHNAEIAISNKILRYNALNQTNIPLPIPPRKKRKIVDDVPDRSHFNNAGLGGFK